MSTVSPTAHLRSPVDLDVVDDQAVSFEALVEGVRLGVLEELEKKLGGLLRPTSLGRLPRLGLGAPADASVEAAERNALLLGDDVLEELHRTTQRHLLDDLSRFPRVLKNIR